MFRAPFVRTNILAPFVDEIVGDDDALLLAFLERKLLSSPDLELSRWILKNPFALADGGDDEGGKHRRSKQPVPDSNKDEKYWRRREKNNLVIFCSTGAGNCDFFWNCVVQSIKSHRFKCPPDLGFNNLLCQPISPSLWHSFFSCLL